MDTKASTVGFDSEIKCRATRTLKARLVRIAVHKDKQPAEVIREAASEKAMKEEKGLRLSPITPREVREFAPEKEKVA